MDNKSVKFKIIKKNDYVPIDFLENIIAISDHTEHIIMDLVYLKTNHFEITFENKTIIESLELFNKNIFQSKSFYETFGKDAFDIEVFEYFPDVWKWESVGKLELNKIKWNLGNIEYIRSEKENK